MTWEVHRIIESSRLEKTSRITKPRCSSRGAPMVPRSTAMGNFIFCFYCPLGTSLQICCHMQNTLSTMQNSCITSFTLLTVVMKLWYDSFTWVPSFRISHNGAKNVFLGRTFKLHNIPSPPLLTFFPV